MKEIVERRSVCLLQPFSPTDDPPPDMSLDPQVSWTYPSLGPAWKLRPSPLWKAIQTPIIPPPTAFHPVNFSESENSSILHLRARLQPYQLAPQPPPPPPPHPPPPERDATLSPPVRKVETCCRPFTLPFSFFFLSPSWRKTTRLRQGQPSFSPRLPARHLMIPIPLLTFVAPFVFPFFSEVLFRLGIVG